MAEVVGSVSRNIEEGTVTRVVELVSAVKRDAATS